MSCRVAASVSRTWLPGNSRNVEVVVTKCWLSSLLALLLFTNLAGFVYAQVEQGTIAGRVFDEAGGVVPGASVIVPEAGTGLARDALADGVGPSGVPDLPVGVYPERPAFRGVRRAR